MRCRNRTGRVPCWFIPWRGWPCHSPLGSPWTNARSPSKRRGQVDSPGLRKAPSMASRSFAGVRLPPHHVTQRRNAHSIVSESQRQESNLQPPVYKTGALPVELRRLSLSAMATRILPTRSAGTSKSGSQRWPPRPAKSVRPLQKTSMPSMHPIARSRAQPRRVRRTAPQKSGYDSLASVSSVTSPTP